MFDIYFGVFLTATVKVRFLEERLGTKLYFQPDLRFFQYFLSLKSFGYSWGNSYTKSAILDILDITFRFTCGKWDPY